MGNLSGVTLPLGSKLSKARIHSVAARSREASNPMSKRSLAVRSSTRSSASVSKSKSSVAMPASCSTPATNRLRGLRRLDPEPWANSTKPRGSGGTLRSPCSVIFPIGMLTARSLVLICHSSYRRRISLRQLACFPLAGSLEGLDGAGFVHMNHRVELLRWARFEVMAHALGFRQIDHADGALQTLARERLLHLAVGTREQYKFPQIRLMKNLLPASQQRGTHAFALGGPAPIAGCSHGAGIGRESDQERFITIAFTHQLSEI